MKFEQVRHLVVYQGADCGLFETPIKFPKLRETTIASSAELNAHYLKCLSDNYPLITSLGIEQRSPLSDDEVHLLSSF